MVNQQFNFAVHIMTALACSGGKMDSAALARSVNTNPVVVRRLLLALRRAGLVETFAGKGGGAQLGRPASAISLRDIYDAIEAPPIIPTHGRKAWKHCRVSCGLPAIMAAVSSQIETVLRENLETITLRKLMRRLQP